MARKEKFVTIPAAIEGFDRDNGKVFFIREMPAIQAEKWAVRAFLALARAGVDVPEGIERAGFAGIAMMTLRSLGGVMFEDAEPLMDELMQCVQYVPDPAKPAVMRGDFIQAGDIEEVPTLLFLRTEVFDLHSNFSALAARWDLKSLANWSGWSTTSTSQDQLEP